MGQDVESCRKKNNLCRSQGCCSDQPEAKKLIAAEAELEVCIAQIERCSNAKIKLVALVPLACS